MDDNYKLYPLDTRYKVLSDGTVIGAKGKPMKPSCDPAGRMHVMIGHDKCQAVHIVVAMAWLPNPNNLPEVNHKNGIPSDNQVDNLEWCTKEYNMKHASDTRLMVSGVDHYLSKLDELQVKVIKSLFKDGLTNIQLGGYFRVDRNTIRPIRRGLTWKHVL